MYNKNMLKKDDLISQDVLNQKTEETPGNIEENKPLEDAGTVTIDLNEISQDNEKLKKENEELKNQMSALNEKFDLLLSKPSTTKIVMPVKNEPLLSNEEKQNKWIKEHYELGEFANPAAAIQYI